MSANSFSPVTKHQEVTLSGTGSLDLSWQVLHMDPERRIITELKPVPANTVIVLKHVQSNNHLASSNARYPTSFGGETEVCCHRFLQIQTKKKDQPPEPQNLWALVTAASGSTFVSYRSQLGGDNILEVVKQKLLQRGGSQGFRGLARTLRLLDKNRDTQISKEEFKRGLQVYGVPLEDTELGVVFSKFDRDGSGQVNVTEFLRTLRGDLPEQRKGLVLQAYKLLDANADGVVTLADLKRLYDTSKHPAVVSGEQTPEQVLALFAAGWDKNHDGTITVEEFVDYYSDISAGIDDDVYFELMMRNAWHISGGEGQAANTTCRRVLVIHNDDSQTVEEIKNDLGIGPNDLDKMRRNLEAQGIRDIKRIALASAL